MNSNENLKDYNEYTFGKYIRSRREQLGLSCRKLAQKLEMTAVYLSDIESGKRKAPLKVRNGKNYMSNFIQHLQISEEEIPSFYAMAVSTREGNPEIAGYLKHNKYALAALHLAKEIHLSDVAWQGFISLLLEIKSNQQIK